MRIPFSYILVVVFSLTWAHPVLAQDCNITITGRVIYSHDQQPLEFATLYFEEAEKGILTDSTGRFIVRGLCSGKYHITISHIGCSSVTNYIEIGGDTIITFTLEHHDELLEEVEISGLSVSQKSGTVKSTLSGEMLEQLKGRSIAEVLTALPGVQMIQSGPGISKPMVQGLTGNRIMIYNQGLPLEGQQWGNDHSPELTADVAEQISVIRGMASIKYGTQAMGGVVLIESESGSFDPHWHSYLSIRSASNGRAWGLHSHGKRTTKIGNLSLHGGFQQSGDHQAPHYFLTNTGNKNHFFTLQLNSKENTSFSRKLNYSYYYNNTGVLRAAHAGNLTDLNQAFNRPVPLYTDSIFRYQIGPPRQEVMHHTLSYRHTQSILKETELHLIAGLQTDQRKEFDLRRGQRSDRPALNLFLISGFTDFFLNHSPEKTGIQHTVGIQTRYRNNTNIRGTGIRPLIPDYINFNGGLYYIAKKSQKKFAWEFGIRSELRQDRIWQINESNEIIYIARRNFNLAANSGVKYKISNHFDTYFDVSYTERPPEINELFSNGLHQGLGSIEEGNQALRPEKSWRISNDWQGHILKNHHIHATLFYSKTNGFIYLQPSGELRLTIRGAFPVFGFKEADVNMYGINLRTTSDLGSSFQLITSANLLRTVNANTGKGLPLMPPFNSMIQIFYTVGKTNFFDECRMGLEVQYTAQQNKVNPEEDFLPPPGSYIVTNGSVTIKWKTKNGNQVSAFVRADNLLNQIYRDYMNRLRYFADEPGRNISARLQLNF